MRHNKQYAKLGRESSHRRAMLRNMATSFLIEGRIATSVEKAKAVKPIVEKLVTLGKRGDLHARRRALAYLYKKEAVSALFGKYADRFKEREGGYTRIVKLGKRFGDGMNSCFLELVDYTVHEGKAKKELLESNREKKMARAEAGEAGP